MILTLLPFASLFLSAGSDRVIQPFDAHSAEGQEILWRLSDGAFQQEYYVMHFPPLNAVSRSDPTVTRSSHVLASNRHLFCLSGTTPLLMNVVWKCSLLSVASIRRTHKDGLVVELKGSDISLSAPHFYTHEITFLIMALQRLIREAQGRRDMTNWEDVSAPILPIVGGAKEEKDDGDEDDFVFVK